MVIHLFVECDLELELARAEEKVFANNGAWLGALFRWCKLHFANAQSQCAATMRAIILILASKDLTNSQITINVNGKPFQLEWDQ